MLLRPSLLELSEGRRPQSAGFLAEQSDQRLLEVAGGDALEVEDLGTRRLALLVIEASIRQRT
jgi:hypothetical protein